MKIKNTIGYLLVVVSLYSQQAKCEVDPTLKQVTDKLNAAGIYPNEEALNREFEYGNEQLSFEERAQREAKLLSDQVTKTTLNAFEKSFNELNDIEAAKKEVLEYMEEELSLVSDEFKPLLKLQVNKALEFSNSSAGIENSEKLLAIMKKTSQERTAIIEMALTTGANNMAKSGGHGESDDDAASNIEVDNRGPLSPRNFNSKNDVALELVKDKRNERWVNTTNSTVRVGEMTSSKAKFALNVNIEFMGAKAEFGPTIAFWKEYTTSVTLLTEGLTPMFNQNGVFDYYVRDNQGRAIRENGDYVRRLIIFTCNAEEEFGTEYGGEGEFKIPIIGGDIGPVAVGLEVQANLVKAKEFSNFVSLESRRIMVPETIAGVQTTVAVLAEICHQYFLNAKVENNKTVKQNLDLVMTNLLSGLTFKSPKTRCVNHSQCGTWYNTKVLAIHKHKTVARCVEQNRQEAMYTCALRGGAGANCTVMKDGKRVSSGLFEYPCEPGLTCKIVHTGGYFQNWELWDDYVGECRR